MRQLSRLSAVSPSTVWKEISLLQKNGKLLTRWGHEIKIVKRGSRSPVFKSKVTRQPKWQLIRDRISNDFLNGHYRPGTPLPGIKELQLRYSVSYPTIIKVLDSLWSAGSIDRSGRNYLIARSNGSIRWRSKIVLISAGTPSGKPKITTEREREFYHFLSLEAAWAQVDLEHVFYEDWGAKPIFYTPLQQQTKLTDNDNVLGYILSSWHIRDYTKCLRWLSVFKKPVAVWIEKAFDDVRMMRSQRAYFNIGYSTIPGRRMGEHFLKLGHKEVAYLSPFHGSKWSQERCAGLFNIYKEMGKSYKIHPFTNSSASSEWDFQDLAQKGDVARQQELLFKTVSESLHPCLRLRMDQFRYDSLRYIRDSLILKSMEEQIFRILENRFITAIAAANDLCALLVLDLLKSLRVEVPQRISLAGFDNTFDSLTNRLTSYSFNTHSLVRAMIRHVTGDSFSPGAKEMQFFDGEVIERATTQVLK